MTRKTEMEEKQERRAKKRVTVIHVSRDAQHHPEFTNS